jgi:hypothetical protein
MNAEQLHQALQAQGYSLAVEGNRLRLYPACRLTAELREAIRAHKAELLALVIRGKPPEFVSQDSEDVTAGRERDPTVMDTRPVWVHYSNGFPERVYTVDRIPPEATFWCREGDSEWKPLHQSESGLRQPGVE